MPEDSFGGSAARCNTCKATTEQRYHQSDKGKQRKETYYRDHGDVIRARANRQHHERCQDAPYLFITARRRAKRSNIPFTITQEDVVIPLDCPVLGIPLKFTLGGRTNNTPSLDRIDNNRGYVPGNVAVISWRANFMKRDLTVAEIHQLYEYVTPQGRQDD